MGSVDCGGLFTIALASVIAKREDPSSYNFNQQTMRDHLHQCLSNGVFIDFPVRKTSRKNDKVCHTFQVYTINVSYNKTEGFPPPLQFQSPLHFRPNF